MTRRPLQRLTCYPTGVVEATARWSGQPHAAPAAPTSRTRWRTDHRRSSTSDARPGRLTASPTPHYRGREGRDAVGTTATTTVTDFAGIDVSKDTLDAALLGRPGRPARSGSP